MIIFKYNKQIDNKVWKEITSAGTMFGFEFPKTINISENDIKLAQRMSKKYSKWFKIKENEIRKALYKIYQNNLPAKFICYITTSKFSTTYKNNPVVSMHRNNKIKFYTSIAHELAHVLYYKYYGKDENLKEVLTVINNIEILDIDDEGWPIFQKQREKALKIWIKTRNLNEVIRAIKPLIKNIN